MTDGFTGENVCENEVSVNLGGRFFYDKSLQDSVRPAVLCV